MFPHNKKTPFFHEKLENYKVRGSDTHFLRGWEWLEPGQALPCLQLLQPHEPEIRVVRGGAHLLDPGP